MKKKLWEKALSTAFAVALIINVIVISNPIVASATTSAPVETKIEAEDTTYCSYGISGSILDASWCTTYAPNASGLGLYNSLNSGVNYEFKVTFNAPTAGKYLVTSRYSKNLGAGGNTVNYPVTVNGNNVGAFKFKTLGASWDIFDESTVILDFNAGANNIIINGAGASTVADALMLDWIKAEAQRTIVNYNFEDNSAIANDVSGKDADGILTGNVTQATGIVGNAASFTGGNIRVPMSILQYSPEFTVEYWVKPITKIDGSTMIDFNDADNSRLLFDFVNGKPRPKIPGLATWGDSSNYDVPVNQWTQVMLTYSTISGKAKLYFNGIFDKEWDGISAPLTLATDLYIGSRVGGAYAFDGLIDEFKLYNYAKTPAKEMIIDYNFEDNTSIAKDASGKAADGIVTGNVTQATGIVGNAASFTGGNITIPMEDLQFFNEFTIEYWINPRSVTNGDYPVMFDFNNTSFLFDFVNGEPRLLNATSGTLNPPVGAWESNGLISANKWTHVSLSYSNISGKIKLYFDGVLDKEWSGMTNTITHTSGLTIGSRVGGALAFDGLIDEFKLYNYERAYNFQTDSIDLQPNNCIVTITNNTIKNVTADVILAQYSADEVLKDIYINNFNIIIGTHSYEITNNIVSEPGDKFSILTWNDINNMVPISAVFTNP